MQLLNGTSSIGKSAVGTFTAGSGTNLVVSKKAMDAGKFAAIARAKKKKTTERKLKKNN